MKLMPEQWGDDIGIPLPEEIVRQAGIKKDVPLKITVENGKILLAPIEHWPNK